MKNDINNKETFINPIDEDKITETPHSLPYAHTVGGAVIKPIDQGKTKGLAVKAMHKQTDLQLEQIRKQMQLLAEQAQKIKKRVEISEIIYGAEMGFKPLIGKTYHLYQRADETAVLSVVGPNEWGRKGCPFNSFLATIALLADHTWEILE
ncbi:DUF2452 domain-containing protein [Aureispira anguillae]|uniref:DUF2452 domain-containing protein n=1 Tax=Aureispira anguillae TaxID=2864201 RepID=A0A916DT25_9BACT|nr:DUF2452 domain-containing protein [Aureispira anguillae]BDS12276.1 DUF2452 domain-containing protein [Aureispira anguillae]